MQKTFNIDEINNFLASLKIFPYPFTEEAIIKANKIKKYVSKNIEFIHPANIHVGDRVVVVDGSYMIDSLGNTVTGIYFRKNGEFEVLVVEEINKYYPTDYSFPNVLGHHNNCKIRGYDGNVYYCSLINIRRVD